MVEYKTENKELNDCFYSVAYRIENGIATVFEERWFKNKFEHDKSGDGFFHLIEYDKNGNKTLEHWYDENNQLHSDNDSNPAVTLYYKNGNKKLEEWFKNGKKHRDKEPALIEYDENGDMKKEEWYLDGSLIMGRIPCQQWISHSL